MPRFHFNAIAGTSVVPDEDGEELLDIKAARLEAVATARDLLINGIRSQCQVPDSIQVTDSNGLEVLRVVLSEMLPKSMKK